MGQMSEQEGRRNGSTEENDEKARVGMVKFKVQLVG